MDRKEILRYLRTSSATEDERTLELADWAAEEIIRAAKPKSLYRIYDITVNEDGVNIGGAEFKSARLAENMAGCKRAVVFGATLGLGVDRLINTALATDTAKAMALSAAANVYIEEVCDALEEDIKAAHCVKLRRRYSPGYFDLDITQQKQLFTLIELTKRIGITLTDTCQMVPSKSVTAFIGTEDKDD